MKDASSAAGISLEVVAAQRKLVHALQQQGEAVGGRHRRGERIQAGGQRLVAQQARAEALERGDRQLLVRTLDLRLQPGSQRVGGG